MNNKEASKVFLKLIHFWNVVSKTFVVIISAVILIFFSAYLFSQSRLFGDTASHVLLAVSPILKIGSPYKNFWDIKPPMLPLVLYLWSNLFGFSILSMRIINILIALLVITVGYLIYKRVFKTPVLEIIFLFTVVIVLSPLLNSIMLPTELLGLLLSLAALLVLIGIKKDFPRFYFSGLLFFAASQAKEPFTFTILAVIPVFLELLLQQRLKKLFKNLSIFLLGILTCFVGIYVYLVSLGSVGSYMEVFRFKQMFYPFTFDRLWLNFSPAFFASERMFIEFSRSFSILLSLVVVSFYFVNRFKNIINFDSHGSSLIVKSFIAADSEKIKKYTVLFYAIGSFSGLGLGGSFGSHYLIQSVFPFYMITGFILSYIFSCVLYLFKKSTPFFLVSLILFIFSIIVLLPKRPYFSYYLHANFKLVAVDRVYSFEKRITELTNVNQCILSVYGWGSGENYLYAERRPCTRFFLPNIVLQDWQKKEYKDSILEDPPMAIIYQTLDTDMDIKSFESQVINLSKIIKNCYLQDTVENVVYVPKTKNLEELKACIKSNSI